jgi:hypothetical protein
MKTSYIVPFLVLAAGAAVACDPTADAPDDDDHDELCPTWYADEDRDGHGDPDAPRTSCTPEPGWVESGKDCDDTTAYVNPDLEEVCDGIDNDCAPTTVDLASCADRCKPVLSADKERSYLFCEDRMPWFDASDTCKRHGFYLAQVGDLDENEFIARAADVAFGRAIDEHWLGGSDLRSEGVWRWEDGMQFWEGLGTGSQFAVPGRPYQDVYSNWPPDGSQPDEYQGDDCLTQWGAGATRAGRWNDKRCDEYLPFVCERD